MNRFSLKRFPAKKGQMEMMGLVVIVVLLTLGMFFLTLFSFDEKPDKKIFTRKGLAASTMSALLKTTIPQEAQCHPERAEVQPAGEDLLRDCATSYPTTSTLYQCEHQDSCAYFRIKAAELLEQTLGKWGKHYQLSSRIIRGRDQPTNLINPIFDLAENGCAAGERDSSGLHPIPFEGGLIENELWVCD